MTELHIDSLGRSRLLRRVWTAMGRPPSWVAGGFVRDRLLGRRSTDLDLSLPGDAHRVAAPAARLGAVLGVRPHLLGRAPSCVWRVQTRDLKVDLWPLGDLDLEEDVRRRDFACNALQWQLPSGPLVDLVGGVDDLKMRRLRAVARENLHRDPVRLLRGPRFVANLPGFALEGRTAGWIRELAPRLAAAPRERIGQELALLLGGGAAHRGLAALLELDLLAPAAPVDAAPQPAWLAHHLDAARLLAAPAAHPVPASVREAGDGARLALLLRAWGAGDPRSLAPYAWPRDDLRHGHRAASLLEHALSCVAAPAPDRREVIWETGDAFPSLLALGAAVAPGESGWRSWWRLWRRSGASLLHPPHLLDGRDVATLLGLEAGPQLGRALHDLTRAQVRGAFRSPAGARRWLLHRFRRP